MKAALKSIFAYFRNTDSPPRFLRNANNHWVEEAYVVGFEAGIREAMEIAESAAGLITSIEEHADQTDGWNRAAKAIALRISTKL